MDVPRLEAFVEVARLGSMRAASRSLHLGQPALSARIATLEDELGARVFERTKRGVRLTSAGHALLPHAERVLESVAAGRTAVSQVEQGDEGELVIAAASAINASLVPELVARFRRFHPGVHLYVHTGSAERVAEQVAFGIAQLGLVRERGDRLDPRLRSRPLFARAAAADGASGPPLRGARPDPAGATGRRDPHPLRPRLGRRRARSHHVAGGRRCPRTGSSRWTAWTRRAAWSPGDSGSPGCPRQPPRPRWRQGAWRP